MSDRSAIEWTDATWNPIRARNLKTGKVGWHCEHATTGCEFCYSEGFNKRLGTGLPFKPGHRKDIEIFLDEETLTLPRRWKKPRKIFVCSMTDLFADFVPDAWRDRVFAVMALCPQHTFQVLTKRAERMRKWFEADRADSVGLAMLSIVDRIPHGHRRVPWPLRNVWLGVSAERQQEADERVPLLLQTPAAVRFVSCEPLLGPIDLTDIANDGDTYCNALRGHPAEDCQDPITAECWRNGVPRLDWIIVGGESGKAARPMHQEWVRDIRDQCSEADMKFFFKQWGEWLPGLQYEKHHQERDTEPGEYSRYRHKIWTGAAWADADEFEDYDDSITYRVGKKASGRLLDGREWNEFPQQTTKAEAAA